MNRTDIKKNIEWMGAIPEKWDIGRIGGLYSLRNTKVNDIDYPPLSVSKQGVVPQMDTVAKTNDHSNRKLVKKGDFAINSRSDRRNSCGISNYDGSVSLINTVLKPRDNMNAEYYDWLFHTTEFADEFYKWGHGIVDDLWTTGWDDMKKIFIPVPPLQEQIRIADYLKIKCAEISELQETIEREIEKLKNYKLAVITEATTTGIEEVQKFKMSSIPFVEAIPFNWDEKRFKYIATNIFKGTGITKEDVDLEGDIQCVRYGEIYSQYDNSFIKSASRTNSHSLSSKQYISKGDILFAATGELIDEIGKNIMYKGDEPCLAGGDIIIASVSKGFDPRFVNYALSSHYSQSQKSCGKSKLKVVHISPTDIGNIRIAFPEKEEQVKIADYLDNICNEADMAINIKNKQLNILMHYRKVIIYEYVTGKKEVPLNE